MFPLQRGKYRARLADQEGDLAKAQALRNQSFRSRNAGNLPLAAPSDADRFDALCRHVLIEDIASGRLVCCYRLLTVGADESMASSYAGQFYDLTTLRGFAGAKLELGRFCVDPAWHDPDILRLAWGAITAIVDAESIGLLFGCSSFDGALPEKHAAALDVLRRHIAPSIWNISVKSETIHPFAQALSGQDTDSRAAMATMPPLLRTYLAMGGWVSDHAVLDHDLDTLHVFTAVEIAGIPAARARALRLIASGHAPD